MASDFNTTVLAIINKQRQYLTEREEDFKKQCDQITALTEEKLKNIPQNDTEARNKIYEEQKQLLEDAFAAYREDLNKSQNQTRKVLEELQSQREEEALNELESRMAEI